MKSFKSSSIEHFPFPEVEVAGGKVVNAWSFGQMFRGIEIILQGRDPRDAHHFVQRSCGV